MRTISILFIIFLCIPAIGQIDVHSEPCDCPYAFIENRTDQFNSEVDRSLAPTLIGTSSQSGIAFEASISQFGEEYKIHLFYPGDLGCISSQSHALFTFIDGTKVDVEHTGYTDCDDDLHFEAKVFDEISAFRTMAIDKILLHGTDTSVELSIDQATYFLDAFNCCIF